MGEEKKENSKIEVDYEEIEKEGYEKLVEKLKNKKIVLKAMRYGDRIKGVFADTDMEDCSKRQTELTISRIEPYDTIQKRVIFTVKEMCEYFEMSMIERFINNDFSQRDNNADVEKDKIIGSKCKISINSDNENTKTNYLYGIPVRDYLRPLENFENVELIALNVNDEGIVTPYFLDGEYKEIIINVNNLQIIEENYLQNIRDKKRHSKEEQKIIDDIDTMSEMISKVNIKDFKKVYAGAMRRIPNKLKGIELLLNQWAFNKKHLYRLFDNNLSIKKEVEYKMTPNDFRETREKFYQEYPIAPYVLDNIDSTELIENKLQHNLNGNKFNLYSRNFKSGERVSKVIEEVFKNEKMNIYYSDILANVDLKGIVEISLDPIEYLLMSTNKSGWDSCHKIYRFGSGAYSFGGYSGGIFSYMCDDVSLIAFRHSNKLYDFNIGKQKINAYSKNWRQMIWINKNFKNFVSSRQYPCQNDELNKEVREMLQEQISKEIGNENWVHSTNMKKIIYLLGDNRKSAYLKSPCPLHYNDMLNGFNGDLSYIKNSKLESKSVIVGSYPICPNCGKALLTENNLPICKECWERQEGEV